VSRGVLKPTSSSLCRPTLFLLLRFFILFQPCRLCRGLLRRSLRSPVQHTILLAPGVAHRQAIFNVPSAGGNA